MKSTTRRLTAINLGILCVALQACSPVRVTSEEVGFRSAGVRLSGTLFFPEGRSPTAAAVFVHGSGPTKRMSSMARWLASEGIAVLTYDKRGVGQSGGTYEGSNNISAINLELLAEDAVAGLRTLDDDHRLTGIPRGFVGLSQAGWIVPIAATKSPEVAFIALLSGPVCTVSEELHFSALAEDDPDFWETHTTDEVAKYMGTVQYRSDDVDPRASLRHLTIPGFWSFGGQDNSIPVELSVTRLDGLIQQGMSNFEYTIVPGYGHGVEGKSDPRFQLMITWIRKTASVRLRMTPRSRWCGHTGWLTISKRPSRQQWRPAARLPIRRWRSPAMALSLFTSKAASNTDSGSGRRVSVFDADGLTYYERAPH